MPRPPHCVCALTRACAAQTVFVGRLSYDISESKLRREFEAYGPIKSLRLVHDIVTDKPRGYAFVEFHSQRDMKTAYKAADGKKLEGRRVVVDVERGRTVPGWQPRRLGGGLGGTRLGGKSMNQLVSGRDTGYRPGGGAPLPFMTDEPRVVERSSYPERERERAPMPRGDTRPGAEKERPRERERERERERSPDRRRSDRRRSRSRSRDRSRGALLRNATPVPGPLVADALVFPDRRCDHSRDRHRSERRRSRSRDRSRGA